MVVSLQASKFSKHLFLLKVSFVLQSSSNRNIKTLLIVVK